MDLQVTQADGSKATFSAITQVTISDTDSSAPYKAQLVAIQGQLATLQKAVSDALAGA